MPRLRVAVATFLLIACASDNPKNAPPDEARQAQSAHQDVTPERFVGKDFSITRPSGATIGRDEGNFPGADVVFAKAVNCNWFCSLAVTIHRGTQVDQLVTRVLRPTSDDPEAKDYAPIVVDSAVLNGRRAFLVELFCGDCTSRALYIDGQEGVAEIAFSIDSRDSEPDRVRRLLDIAKSFAWN